ncbi:hypothetical protein N7455_006356 [Penicillium solitum]|uniref:uncharacterized protein n=1 Tax=Penicillium solitum TaxID=60172 RepID=UPI0032C42A97|nr:hypothetical protein N7455_006356 [Penicillium solitum]
MDDINLTKQKLWPAPADSPEPEKPSKSLTPSLFAIDNIANRISTRSEAYSDTGIGVNIDLPKRNFILRMIFVPWE